MSSFTWCANFDFISSKFFSSFVSASIAYFLIFRFEISSSMLGDDDEDDEDRLMFPGFFFHISLISLSSLSFWVRISDIVTLFSLCWNDTLANDSSRSDWLDISKRLSSRYEELRRALPRSTLFVFLLLLNESFFLEAECFLEAFSLMKSIPSPIPGISVINSNEN